MKRKTNKAMNQKYSYLTLIILILIGFISGFLIDRWIPKVSPKMQIPLPSEFLVSPLIDSFYANVEGIVVEKKKDSMVLEKDNQRIKIFIAEDMGLTTFTKKNNKINYSDIKIGDNLKGGMSITVKLTPANISTQRKAGDIVGHRFTVI